ncbi:transcriptional adapter 2-beta-like [Ptychodera flava]|uniref:transcriptional adapter 2-beta-like n=1 Tax=Ptychodera flava TaxID=63121 RepID=UPI003969C571
MVLVTSRAFVVHRKAIKMAENTIKYYCNYCQEDISGIRVKCAECTDFDLCLQCFSGGAEMGIHKRGHRYQLIDNGNFSIYSGNWKANEELLMLDGIEQYGFGSWEEISDNVQTKTPAEVMEHYELMYLIGNIGKITLPSNFSTKVIDHTTPTDGPLSPSLTTPFTPVEMSLVEQQELGYMPFRDDFEREYDNDAETLVSNLTVDLNDEDIDIALKLAHVDMFTRKLMERERRKRIAREYGLIQAATTTGSKKMQTKKRYSKDEREFREKIRPFAQFLTSNEQDQLFENLQREKQLRVRIKELMRYRRHGITKMEECAEFESARHKREKRKENKKKMASSGSKRGVKEEKIREEKVNDLNDFQDMKYSQGFNYLSEKEKKLCKSMGMKPARYVTIKTIVIKDHLLRRQGIPTKTRYPSNLDKAHRKRIINFLTNSGWISSS